MPANRFYSNTAVSTTLSSSINNVVTTLTVGATTGFPASFPYTLVIDPDTPSEELVKVTGAVGTTLTVVRGQDGTSATAHSTPAVVKHVVSAQDFTEPQTHMAGNAGVHGLSGGTVVGTTEVQTLTNKTLTAPTVTSPVVDQFGAASGLGAAWTAYTPTIGSNGADATIGNGSITARYKQIGKTVHVLIVLRGGSTSTFGTGGAFLSNPLPVTPHASVATGQVFQVKVWTGTSEGNSGALWTGTRFDFYTGSAGYTGGFSGSNYTISFTYEAA